MITSSSRTTKRRSRLCSRATSTSPGTPTSPTFGLTDAPGVPCASRCATPTWILYVMVVRAGDSARSTLRGNTLALGSRDSAQAAILPIYFLARGTRLAWTSTLRRFDLDVGKHGDTGRERSLRRSSTVASTRPRRCRVRDPFGRAARKPPAIRRRSGRRRLPSLQLHRADAAGAHEAPGSTAAPDGLDDPAHRRLLDLEGLNGSVRMTAMRTCSQRSKSRGSRRRGDERASGGRRDDRRRGSGGAEGLLVAVARLPSARGGRGARGHERARRSSTTCGRGAGAPATIASAGDPEGDPALVRRGRSHRTLALPTRRSGAFAARRRATRVRHAGLAHGTAARSRTRRPPPAPRPRGAAVEPGAPRVPVLAATRPGLGGRVARCTSRRPPAVGRGPRHPVGAIAGAARPPRARRLPVMTFLAENEYAALYVPARFLRRSTRTTPRRRSSWPRVATRPATSRRSRSARWPTAAGLRYSSA